MKEEESYIYIVLYFIQGAESKYNSWTRMCGLIMGQWCKIKLEADIFLQEFEIKITLKEMLIKEKTWNKGRMVCMDGHKGRAFLPTCSLLHLFPAREATNTVTVSGCLKPWVQIFLSFSMKVFQEVMAVSSHEARLPYRTSPMPDLCANWVTWKPREWSVMSPIQLDTQFCRKM